MYTRVTDHFNRAYVSYTTWMRLWIGGMTRTERITWFVTFSVTIPTLIDMLLRNIFGIELPGRAITIEHPTVFDLWDWIRS